MTGDSDENRRLLKATKFISECPKPKENESNECHFYQSGDSLKLISESIEVDL